MEPIKTIQQKLDEGRQYRNFDVSGFERRSADDGEKVVEGYATVFNQPYELYRFSGEGYIYIVREQIDANAFDEADMADVIMQYDHEGRVFARMSNNTLTVTPDEKGLLIEADLGGTELGRQLFEEIRGGYTNKMSFGFTVEEERRDERTDEGNRIHILRTITRIRKLYDVSAVSLPANDATEISARSLGEGAIARIKEERLAEQERQRKIQVIKTLLEV